jgi:hypothetical protein
MGPSPNLPRRCRRSHWGWADFATTCAFLRWRCVRGVFFWFQDLAEPTWPPPNPPRRCRCTPREWADSTATRGDFMVWWSEIVVTLLHLCQFPHFANFPTSLQKKTTKFVNELSMDITMLIWNKIYSCYKPFYLHELSTCLFRNNGHLS